MSFFIIFNYWNLMISISHIYYLSLRISIPNPMFYVPLELNFLWFPLIFFQFHSQFKNEHNEMSFLEMPLKFGHYEGFNRYFMKANFISKRSTRVILMIYSRDVW
jgi:hypothetical protein